MNNLKTKLQTQSKGIQYMKMSDLIINHPYHVESLFHVNTKYGLSVVAVLRDNEEIKQVFLPKSISLTINDIANYNENQEQKLNLIYRGTNSNNAYKYDFE